MSNAVTVFLTTTTLVLCSDVIILISIQRTYAILMSFAGSFWFFVLFSRPIC